LGEEELARDSVTLKDLGVGEERVLPRNEVVDVIVQVHEGE
jgi:histidyl-tRNA synthetase